MFDAEENESDIDESFDDSHVPEADIQGVVLVQLLVLSQFNDESCSIYDHVYLQLSCSKYVKRTHVVPFFTHKETIFDAVKHFPVCIPVTKSAFKNFNLKIEMVMYKAHKDKSLGIDKRQMGVMLFHLKDIMNNRLITGTHEFSKDMTSMAKLELKICYSSGVFGFGYSRRVNFDPESTENEFPSDLEEQLLLSLFPRYKPHPDGADEAHAGILSIKEVPIPDILPMFRDPNDPEIDKFLDESSWKNHRAASLMKDCSRLRRLRLVLLSCDSYNLRKMFLEKLILNNQEMSFVDIKKYKAQKEQDTDNLNNLMTQAEQMGSMREANFTRRMSSTVNQADIMHMFRNVDRNMMDGKLSECDEDPDSSSGSAAKGQWAKLKKTVFKPK